MRAVSIAMASLLIVGCVNTQVVKRLSVVDTKDSEPLNGATATCSGLGLTKDCSIISGATKVISINNTKMRVSSNEAGNTVLIMYDKSECGVTEQECQTIVNNRNYSTIKSFYLDNKIAIISVRALAVSNNIAGYLLTLDKDGYSVLK